MASIINIKNKNKRKKAQERMTKLILASELIIGQEFILNDCINECIGKQDDMVIYYNHTTERTGVINKNREIYI